MVLDGPLRLRIRRALEDALQVESELNDFIDKCDLKRARIPANASVYAIVDMAVTSAETHEWVDKLLDFAIEINPTNNELPAAKAAYVQWNLDRKDTRGVNRQAKASAVAPPSEPQLAPGLGLDVDPRTVLPAQPTPESQRSPIAPADGSSGYRFGFRQADWNSMWQRVWAESSNLLDAIRDQLWAQFAESSKSAASLESSSMPAPSPASASEPIRRFRSALAPRARDRYRDPMHPSIGQRRPK